MTKITNSDISYSGLVEKYIGTAYDTVKYVADNMEYVIAVGQIEDLDSIAEIALEVKADADRAEAAAQAAETSAAEAAASAASVAGDADEAAASAAAAAISAGQASDSAGFAAASEAAAASSEANAATSEANAAISETNADDSFTSFDARYLGAKSSPPTVDNEGNALLEGAMYWDVPANSLKFWDGAQWVAMVSAGITYAGVWDPSAGQEYPTTPVDDVFYIADNDTPYLFVGGDLAGQTANAGDYMTYVLVDGQWQLAGGVVDTSILLHADGSVASIAPQKFQDGGGANEMQLGNATLVFHGTTGYILKSENAVGEEGIHLTDDNRMGINVAAPTVELDVLGDALIHKDTGGTSLVVSTEDGPTAGSIKVSAEDVQLASDKQYVKMSTEASPEKGAVEIAAQTGVPASSVDDAFKVVNWNGSIYEDILTLKSNGDLSTPGSIIGENSGGGSTNLTFQTGVFVSSLNLAKVATITLNAQGQECTARLFIEASGHASPIIYQGTINIAVNQIASLGANPVVTALLYSTVGFGLDTVAYKIISNAGPTVVELYVKIPEVASKVFGYAVVVDNPEFISYTDDDSGSPVAGVTYAHTPVFISGEGDYVGVNTDQPEYPLDVAGTARFSDGVLIDEPAAGLALTVAGDACIGDHQLMDSVVALAFYGTGNRSADLTFYADDTGSPVASLGRSEGANGNLILTNMGNGPLQLVSGGATRISAGGADRFVVDSSGYVGIGVANPTVPLDIFGNTLITGNLTVTGDINGGGGGSSLWTPVTGGINYSGGFVGINNATPAYNLHVIGECRIAGTRLNAADLTINKEVVGDVGAWFGIRASDAQQDSFGIWRSGGVNGSADIFNYGNGITKFGNKGTGRLDLYTNNTNRMTIDGLGKVGIGTATPRGLFDVSGEESDIYLGPNHFDDGYLNININRSQDEGGGLAIYGQTNNSESFNIWRSAGLGSDAYITNNGVGNLHLIQNSITALSIDNAGNVSLSGDLFVEGNIKQNYAIYEHVIFQNRRHNISEGIYVWGHNSEQSIVMLIQNCKPNSKLTMQIHDGTGWGPDFGTAYPEFLDYYTDTKGNAFVSMSLNNKDVGNGGSALPTSGTGTFRVTIVDIDNTSIEYEVGVVFQSYSDPEVSAEDVIVIGDVHDAIGAYSNAVAVYNNYISSSNTTDERVYLTYMVRDAKPNTEVRLRFNDGFGYNQYLDVVNPNKAFVTDENGNAIVHVAIHGAPDDLGYNGRLPTSGAGFMEVSAIGKDGQSFALEKRCVFGTTG